MKINITKVLWGKKISYSITIKGKTIYSNFLLNCKLVIAFGLRSNLKIKLNKIKLKW